MTRLLCAALLALGMGGDVTAEVSVELCYNYGCSAEVPVWFKAADLVAARESLAGAHDAASEREALAESLAALYRVAGGQTPVFADRAGNLRDAGVDGRMDCIDHATSTTRLLELLESRGWLRYHRVGEPARRSSLILQHFSAVIEEVDPPSTEPAWHLAGDHVGYLLKLCDCAEVTDDPRLREREEEAPPPARFAVDSWFVDHGEPAVILPLADWLKGGGPNVQ